MIGGLDVYIRNTIISTNNEFEFVIVKGNDDNNNPVVKNGQTIKEYGIQMYRQLNPIKDCISIIQTIRIIIKEKPDIIHCHSAKGGFVGRLAGFITGRKTFYTPHAFSFLSSNSRIKQKFYLYLERVARLNSYLLACSESEQQLGISKVHYKEEKALVWHNAVPDAAKLIDNKVKDSDEPYICFIGRPSYQKNTFFLLDVVKGIKKIHPEIKFYLVGVGYYSPDLEELKSRITEYNIGDSFVMLPWLSHEETLKYVNNALCYLTVARYEGLPLAVIEAMSLGKAIVASDVLGNKDCVKDGENGFLLPLNVETFVEKLCCLIENKDMLIDMGRNSRVLFEDQFLINNRIALLENTYINV